MLFFWHGDPVCAAWEGGTWGQGKGSREVGGGAGRVGGGQPGGLLLKCNTTGHFDLTTLGMYQNS